MKNFITDHEIKKFNDAKPKNAGALAPRPGQYFIRSIEFREVGIKGIVPIALVNWKQANEIYFVEEALHEIALSGFYRNTTHEKSKDDFNGFIGKFIFIDEIKIDYVVANDRTNEILNYKWSVIETNLPFKNSNQLILEAFWGSAKTINEAQQNFVDNTGYDVAAAEEFEAIGEEFDYDGIDPNNQSYDDLDNVDNEEIYY